MNVEDPVPDVEAGHLAANTASMQAAINDASAKVVALQGIVDESAHDMKDGVHLRLCGALKELYGTVQTLKEHAGMNAAGQLPNESRSEALMRRLKDETVAFDWPDLAQLLLNPGDRWVALEAMQELFDEDEACRTTAAVWDAVPRNLVRVLRDDDDAEMRSSAVLVMVSMIGECELAARKLIGFELLPWLVIRLEEEECYLSPVMSLASLVTELGHSKARAVRDSVRNERGLVEALIDWMKWNSHHATHQVRDNIAGALCALLANKDTLHKDVRARIKRSLNPAIGMLRDLDRVPFVDSHDEEYEYYAVTLLKHLVLLDGSIAEDLANQRAFASLVKIDDGSCPDSTREDIIIILEKAASWCPATRQKLSDQGVYKVIGSTLQSAQGRTRMLAELCALLGWMTHEGSVNDMHKMREFKIPKSVLELLSNRFYSQDVVYKIMEVVRSLCNVADGGMHQDLLDAGVVSKLSALLRDPARQQSHKLAEDSLGMLSVPLEKRGLPPARGVCPKRVLGEW